MSRLKMRAASAHLQPQGDCEPQSRRARARASMRPCACADGAATHLRRQANQEGVGGPGRSGRTSSSGADTHLRRLPKRHLHRAHVQYHIAPADAVAHQLAPVHLSGRGRVRAGVHMR